jgi:SAM-dependent methyltransferase
MAAEKTGMPDLSDKDVLDIGCGTRFTQTIINCDIPIKSYTGIDVSKPVIDYLVGTVKDSRFTYYHWNIYNEAHNPKGRKLEKTTKLPSPQAKKFDAMWMFSVITHTSPTDAEKLLSVLRNYIKPDGRLFFSTFIDNTIDYYENRAVTKAGITAYYNEKVIRKNLSDAGWLVDVFYEPAKYIHYHFVCSPQPGFFERIIAKTLGKGASSD